MRDFQPKADVTVDRRGPPLTPQLLIPVEPGYVFTENHKFPSLNAVLARNSSNAPQPLIEFTNAVSLAKEKLLIIDEYLFKPDNDMNIESRIRDITSWLMNSDELYIVKILSTFGSDVETLILEEFRQTESKINEIRRAQKRKPIVIMIGNISKKFPYIHDRFAIIDNELWHFGATVGGFHRKVNAVSRGWSAKELAAEDFFNTAWQGVSL